MTKGVKGRAKVQEKQQTDLSGLHVHSDDFEQCLLLTVVHAGMQTGVEFHFLMAGTDAFPAISEDVRNVQLA